MDAHPSFFELDLVPLGEGKPQTIDHVKGCARCQAHLRTLEEPIAVPGWAAALRLSRPERRPSWWMLVLLGAAATGAAAVFLLSPTRPHPQDLAPPTHGTLVAAKGSPSVAIYVLRDEQIQLWDGHKPIRPGDRLELQVSGEGLDHVLVDTTPGDFRRPLFSADIDPKQQLLLPESWLVDDSPGDEGLVVVMSMKKLTAEEASAAVAAHRRDGQVWTTTLTLPKATK